MSNELQTAEKTKEKRTPATVANGLKASFLRALPPHIDADYYASVVQTTIQLNPELLDCTAISLMASCMKAANDGLVLDGREAALIIRNVKVGRNPDVWEKQATYQPMAQGLMKLARNSGEIKSITSSVVFRNDKFRHIKGDEESITHEPAGLEEEQGPPIACYCIVKLKNGEIVREVMRKADILNIGSQGKNPDQYDPDKGKNYGEWWRKTLIRRITKSLPKSTDAIGRFVQAAERIDDEFDFSEQREQREPALIAPTRKKRGGAAAALNGINPTPAAETDKPTVETFDDETGEIIDGDFTGGDYAGEDDTPKPKDDF